MFITDEIQHFVSTNDPNTCKRFYTKLCKLLFKNKVLQETNYRCIYCNSLATTLDHIISKNNGGQSLQSNLVGACETCNKSKGTTYWRTWFRQHPNYNEANEKYICTKLKTNKRV
jgi:5-methylcytosine-specific restriction endonuclease McrA